MSSPGSPTQPAGSWQPNLTGLGLPRALTTGVQQSYSLIYSLRDTVTQLQATVRMLIQYGTEKERGQTNPQTVPDGALYFVTDTGKIYQSRLNANSTSRDWVLVVNGVPSP